MKWHIYDSTKEPIHVSHPIPVPMPPTKHPPTPKLYIFSLSSHPNNFFLQPSHSSAFYTIFTLIFDMLLQFRRGHPTLELCSIYINFILLYFHIYFHIIFFVNIYYLLAWLHLLHGFTSCMAPPPAWLHLLHGSTSCMAPPAAWFHLLHGSTSFMAPPPAWLHLLHGSTSCMVPPPAWLLETLKSSVMTLVFNFHSTVHCYWSGWCCPVTRTTLTSATTVALWDTPAGKYSVACIFKLCAEKNLATTTLDVQLNVWFYVLSCAYCLKTRAMAIAVA